MALGTAAPSDLDPSPHGPAPAGRRDGRAFLHWSQGAYLGVTAVLAMAMLAAAGWPLTYVLDDPAIHLSIAEQLARHGTWGVTPGSFESASSAPLWTLLLAPFAALGPPARDWAPLLLNGAAGAAVLAVLAGPGAVLRPSRRRPLDAAATVVLAVVVLFLPGLAVVGMEHTLHVALVLAAVASLADGVAGRRRGPAWAPYALLAMASLTRFETAFVALGLAAGLVVDAFAGPDPASDGDGPTAPGAGDPDGTVAADDAARHAGRDGRAGRMVALRRAAGVLAASGGAIAAFAALNVALGGGLLPNSVLAKGQGTGAAQGDGLGPVDIANRLSQDPLVVATFVLAVGYLAVTWGRRGARGRLAAWAAATATVAHAAVADVGWYERYQAYLIALGAFVGLVTLGELPAGRRRRVLAAALVVAVPLALPKASLLVRAPLAAADMAGHQLQAARFLDRYYDGRPVATTQLGYISLWHDGPLTDFGGLGDQEVLDLPGRGVDLWDEIAERRGVRVAVVYAPEAFRSVPPGWVRAGSFHLRHEPVTAVNEDLEVFATSADELAPLQRHLAEFAAEVPDGVEVRLNEFAELQVAAIEADPP